MPLKQSIEIKTSTPLSHLPLPVISSSDTIEYVLHGFPRNCVKADLISLLAYVTVAGSYLVNSALNRHLAVPIDIHSQHQT